MDIKACSLQDLDVSRDGGPVHGDAMVSFHDASDLVGGQLVISIGMLKQQLIHVKDAQTDIVIVEIRVDADFQNLLFRFLVGHDHSGDGFGGQAGSGFAGMLAVCRIEFCRICQFIKLLSHVCDEGVTCGGRFVIGIKEPLCHLIIGHCHICHGRAAFLISPGGKKDRDSPFLSDPAAEPSGIFQEGIFGCDRAI